ncbi:BA14K family protein [Rhizobium bangladeshense]|uniref:BA14K family protein n=1 Tax=Rhizobium bangladeshense TaxID=1138189 RepID=UPI001C92697C|nr:BA14K family protein [Rhizobium bangladeshense]MBY3594691.1 BA14K family protein [Rhizobium bangladeshense]
MKRLAKTLLLTATLAALTISAIGEASARDRHWRRNDALVGGAVGLATGLIVGSAIANANNGPVYDEPRYIDPPYEPDYYEAAPVYRAPRRVYVEEPRYVERPRYYAPARATVEPWTPQWERYCSYRYRSFDPRSGTYIGYDGRSHFCTAG